jgi:D-glycerate 3-kinase
MPGYELYLESVQRHGAPWEGRGLRLVIGREREVIADERF